MEQQDSGSALAAKLTMKAPRGSIAYPLERKIVSPSGAVVRWDNAGLYRRSWLFFKARLSLDEAVGYLNFLVK